MKGFTLIELITIVILLGVISILGIIGYSNIVKENKERAYDTQVSEIERISTSWVTSHLDIVGYTIPYYLTLAQLMEDSYIASSQIIDPRTDENMTGCVEIRWSNENKQHIITYLETCPY